MNQHYRLLRSVIPLIAFMFLTSIACSIDSSIMSTPGASNQASSNEAGSTRKNPIPLNTLISIPGWDIKVLEFLRGEDALNVVNTPGWQADPLPQGKEYALAKIFLQSTSLEDGYQSLGISEMTITGSHNLTYGDTMDSWPQPEFLFEDIFTAEAVEGWIDAVIPTDEQDLMMVVDVLKDGIRYTRYFALENGASISLPAEFSNIRPNELGVTSSDPAGPGQNVITPAWEVTLLNSIQGQEAETILEKDNPYYSPPAAGFEYLLLQVSLRYINQEDLPIRVGPDIFYALDESGNQVYGDWIYLPSQSDLTWISMKILPGAEIEGWVAINIPAGTEQPVIVFNPDNAYPGENDQNLRYLAIK